MWTNLNVRKVRCPECKAKANEPCYYSRLRYGRLPYRKTNHRSRINRWIEVMVFARQSG